MCFCIHVILLLLLNSCMPTCTGVSRYIEDPLVAFGCCLLYGRVVVALTRSQFPFSILLCINS